MKVATIFVSGIIAILRWLMLNGWSFGRHARAFIFLRFVLILKPLLFSLFIISTVFRYRLALSFRFYAVISSSVIIAISVI